MYGLLVILPRSEFLDQLHWCPHGSEGRYLEHLRVIEIKDTLILVFLEERFEHCAGLSTVFGEHVALAHVFSTFSARKRRLIESNMADKVERIEVFPDFLGQQIQRQLLLLQLLDNSLFPLGCGPALQKLIQASAQASARCVQPHMNEAPLVAGQQADRWLVKNAIKLTKNAHPCGRYECFPTELQHVPIPILVTVQGLSRQE